MNLNLGQSLTTKEFAELTNRTKIVKVESEDVFDLTFTLADGSKLSLLGARENEKPLIVVEKLAARDF